jgi:hypothetical protein
MIVLSQLSTPLHFTPFFLIIFSTFGKCENLTLKKAAASYTESNFPFFGSNCQDIEVPQQQLRNKQTWLRYLQSSLLAEAISNQITRQSVVDY